MAHGAAQSIDPRTVFVAPTTIQGLAQDGGRIAWAWGTKKGCSIDVYDLSARRSSVLSDTFCVNRAFVLAGDRLLWRHYQDVSDFWEEFRFQTARAGEAKARPAEAMFEYGGATGRLPPKDPVPVAGDGSSLVYYVAHPSDDFDDPLAERVWRVVAGRSMSTPGTRRTIALAAQGPWFAAVRAEGEAPYVRPTWSPDGTRVAWVGAGGLRVSSGGRERVVVRGASAFSWSPDGSQLAAVVGARLSVVLPDGSARRMLPGSVDAGHPWVSWSPDGTALAVSGTGSPRRAGDLRVVPIEGLSPTWSPDGDRIAFVDEEGAVFVADAGGAARRQVGTAGNDLSNVETLANEILMPAWSPDGTRLAVAAGDLTVIDLVSGKAMHLRGVHDAYGPLAWSPSGSWIAFAQSLWQLTLTRADGSSVKRLGRGRHPSWHPSGERVLFTVPSLADGYEDSSLAEIDVLTGKVTKVRPSTVRVEVRRTSTGALRNSFEIPDPASAVALTASSVILLVGNRLEMRSLSGRLRRSTPMPVSARQLSASARWAVYADGRAIWAIDLVSGRKRLVGHAEKTPVGLSIEATRVVWAEGRAVRTVELPG